MNYEEAVRYLLTLGSELAAPRQPASMGGGPARVAKFDLRNISVLADRLGSPHRAVPCAHIAGTNGKGSTAAMLESILRAAGLRTGLFTSPHLERINERIRIASEEISDEAFAESFTRVHALIEALLASGSLAAHPTYFECLTAMAFDAFAGGCHPERSEGSGLALKRSGAVDFSVYEVGMGGRLDSTNLVEPAVAVITPIDFDHENYLGHSIEEIAGEKAGIIKQGAWVVSAAQRPEARAVIRRRCEEMGARLVEIDDAYSVTPESLPAKGAASGAPTTVGVHEPRSNWRLEIQIPLPGRYQIRNALTAIAAARLLAKRGFAITDDAITGGIAAVRWPGRLELLQARPAVYLDGTHNAAGARELLNFWDEECAGRRIHLVYAAVRDKSVDEIAGLLFPRAASVILTEPRQPRAISAAALKQMTEHLAPHAEVVADPSAAMQRAIDRAAPDDVVFATGSLYLVGALRRWWRERSASPAPALRKASS
jgi:dihydrofolate synthase/folylpolyglutamate synthase